MSTSAQTSEPRAVDVEVTATELSVKLADGRRISAPLEWYPRLLAATPGQRANWTLSGDGVGIHWPEVDEDLSVSGLLAGVPDVSRRRSGSGD